VSARFFPPRRQPRGRRAVLRRHVDGAERGVERPARPADLPADLPDRRAVVRRTVAPLGQAVPVLALARQNPVQRRVRPAGRAVEAGQQRAGRDVPPRDQRVDPLREGAQALARGLEQLVEVEVRPVLEPWP
jgi:hypothetical protein